MSQYSAVVGMLSPFVFFPAHSNVIDLEPATTYPVGTSPSAIVTGDFNGDGNPIWRLRTPAGTSPQAIPADDFNGDGKLDLVATHVGDSSKNRFQESRDRRRAKP